MSETLVDFDPVTKTETHVAVSDEGVITTATFQDVEDIVEASKAAYNATDERARYGEKFTHMAHIPITIWFELVRLGIAQDEKALRKWLDNPDYKDFRTRPGKLSR